MEGGADDAPRTEGSPMSDQARDTHGAEPAGGRGADALRRIDAALRGLRFGTVTAVVQDGVVVQVERTEILGHIRSRP